MLYVAEYQLGYLKEQREAAGIGMPVAGAPLVDEGEIGKLGSKAKALKYLQDIATSNAMERQQAEEHLRRVRDSGPFEI